MMQTQNGVYHMAQQLNNHMSMLDFEYVAPWTMNEFFKNPLPSY
jgi:hypothetical protein